MNDRKICIYRDIFIDKWIERERYIGIVNWILVYFVFLWRLFVFFFIFLGVKFE